MGYNHVLFEKSFYMTASHTHSVFRMLSILLKGNSIIPNDYIDLEWTHFWIFSLAFNQNPVCFHGATEKEDLLIFNIKKNCILLHWFRIHYMDFLIRIRGKKENFKKVRRKNRKDEYIFPSFLFLKMAF